MAEVRRGADMLDTTAMTGNPVHRESGLDKTSSTSPLPRPQPAQPSKGLVANLQCVAEAAYATALLG